MLANQSIRTRMLPAAPRKNRQRSCPCHCKLSQCRCTAASSMASGAVDDAATVSELLTIRVRDQSNPYQGEELMDTPTSAAPDEQTPPTRLSKEKSKPS